MIIDHPRRRKKGESLPQLFINREKIKRVDKTSLSNRYECHSDNVKGSIKPSAHALVVIPLTLLVATSVVVR